MKKLLYAGAAMALALPHMAAAQDHSSHQTGSPAPAPVPAQAEGEHAPMDHSPGVERSVAEPEAGPAMDHSQMDHSAMDHAQAPDMKHAATGDTMPEGPAEGSGTARLPQAEGMMPGLHLNIGGGWMGMAHGYVWGVYTRQTGPRGDDKLYVQTMAMLTCVR